nr:EI24 domain-containing protein [Bacteroidota bacterium]
EAILHNKTHPFGIKTYLKDVIRGIRIALRNALWQTVYTVSILFLSLIPLVGWATPVLAVFVECFYFGFSMLDYTNKRKGLSFSESIDFINRQKGLATGNGMVFYLMHTVPFAGWIFAPGYAVIAATLSMQRGKTTLLEKQKIQE